MFGLGILRSRTCWRSMGRCCRRTGRCKSPPGHTRRPVRHRRSMCRRSGPGPCRVAVLVARARWGPVTIKGQAAAVDEHLRRAGIPSGGPWRVVDARILGLRASVQKSSAGIDRNRSTHSATAWVRSSIQRRSRVLASGEFAVCRSRSACSWRPVRSAR